MTMKIGGVYKDCASHVVYSPWAGSRMLCDNFVLGIQFQTWKFYIKFIASWIPGDPAMRMPGTYGSLAALLSLPTCHGGFKRNTLLFVLPC